jgi:hypothetical protein
LSAVRLFISNELLAAHEDRPQKALKGADGRDVLEETLTNPVSEIIPEALKKDRAWCRLLPEIA